MMTADKALELIKAEALREEISFAIFGRRIDKTFGLALFWAPKGIEAVTILQEQEKQVIP